MRHKTYGATLKQLKNKRNIGYKINIKTTIKTEV